MNPIEAPGKVFLAGEYAVLDPGRPALVAAVDLKLQAVWETAPRLRLIHRPSGASWESGAPPDELRFAVRAVQMASRFCGGEPGMRLVFDNDMASRHVKLGLGGSAAASVIAVRAACAAAGREISEDHRAVPAARTAGLAGRAGERGQRAGVQQFGCRDRHFRLLS